MRKKTRKMNSELRDIVRKIQPQTAGNKSRGTLQAKLPFDNNDYQNFSRTQRYWTSGREFPNAGENMKDEQSPFAFPSCSQTLAYLQWWKAQKKKTISEHGKKIRKDKHKALRSNDILQRLRVDVEIEAAEAKKHKDLNKVIAMTDVDPQYFTELSGETVKEKFSLDEYIRDIRETLRTRLLIDQERDECICIDQQFEQETRRLRQIQQRCQRYVSGFEEFLSKDHEKSMRILEKAEREAKLTEEISDRRNVLAKQYGQSRLDVYVWEDNWRLVKMCQMFLHQVSPVSWRARHDRSLSSELERNIAFADALSTDLFSKYKMLDENVSLETLIEMFEQDVADAGPAELYFEDPFDLIRIFRTMETQNLNALIHLDSFTAPIEDMIATIAVTEIQIKQEIDGITSVISSLENSIAKAESRAASLEEYANYLLRDVFRSLVCSEEVLYLRVFIEDTYESCVGPNDANLDSFSMMKWIERVYEDLNLQLDNLPREIVRTCEREGFQQEMKALRDAEDATRKFELMHRLLDALKRILEPPAKKKRPVIRRSAPITLKTRPMSRLLKPTDEEAQYLTFFTDYCRHDDFVTYCSKFPDDFDLTFLSKRDDIESEKALDDAAFSQE
ncbi:hypothetical protein PUN28_009069 [Cardiocondyla obscurior]|uniref:DUF4200 domain-containing protein n=2 Tax=Cardiocondyla obscurior TaxID=286306 RepID=A0AAW2FTQ7_9HYME